MIRQSRRLLVIASATHHTGEQKGSLPIRGALRDEWLEDRDSPRVIMVGDRPPRQVESPRRSFAGIVQKKMTRIAAIEAIAR